MIADHSMNFVPDTDLKLGTIFQAFADLVLVIDSDGSILDYKMEGAYFPSHSSNPLKDRKIQEIIPPEMAGRFERASSARQKQEQIPPFEFSLVSGRHTRWFDARVAPFNSTQMIMFARDITKQKQAETKLQQQLKQLSALRAIDLAIASGLDLNLLLSILLDQVTSLLRVDAADILLLKTETNTLNFSSGKGFDTSTLQHTRLKLGDDDAGIAALERRMVTISNLAAAKTKFARAHFFERERFVTYYGVPLMAKGRTLGVLEIFHRSPLDPDGDWLEFLNTIAGQAAIAIDSAMMFKDLQRSNVELGLAYDATIEGWVRTLDIRDKEIEGHTRRVTELAVKLAMAVGIDNENIVNIRRGAILHDIGKVAIPDQILFKPGPLTDDEWKVMRKHPSIAVDLLSPISHLAPALDIPRWHHEKWDGTGYPDRLQGDQIPYSARLFAVIDVYDALISDRPYRSAWRKEDAIRYIENQSGKHFDPRVVLEFMKLVKTNLYGIPN